MSPQRIGFNIWDDYNEKGGDTYGYVEDSEINEEEKEKIAQTVYEYINKNIKSVTVKLNGSDVEFFDLSHKRRETLVHELRVSGIKYKGVPVNFYSES
jgi:hypothetical protein